MDQISGFAVGLRSLYLVIPNVIGSDKLFKSVRQWCRAKGEGQGKKKVKENYKDPGGLTPEDFSTPVGGKR